MQEQVACKQHPQLPITKFCSDLTCPNAYHLYCTQCPFDCGVDGHLSEINRVFETSFEQDRTKINAWKACNSKLTHCRELLESVINGLLRDFDERSVRIGILSSYPKLVSMMQTALALERETLQGTYQQCIRDFDMRNSDNTKFFTNTVLRMDSVVDSFQQSGKQIEDPYTLFPQLKKIHYETIALRSVLDKNQMVLQRLSTSIDSEQQQIGRVCVEITETVWKEYERRCQELALAMRSQFQGAFNRLQMENNEALNSSELQQTTASYIHGLSMTSSIAHSEYNVGIESSLLQMEYQKQRGATSSGGSLGASLEDYLINSQDYYQHREEMQLQNFGYIGQNLTNTLRLTPSVPPVQDAMNQSTYCLLGIPFVNINLFITAGEFYILLWGFEPFTKQWKILSKIVLNDQRTSEKSKLRIMSMQILWNPVQKLQIDGSNRPKEPLWIVGAGNCFEIFSLDIERTELTTELRIQLKAPLLVHAILPLQHAGSWKHFVAGTNEKHLVLYSLVKREQAGYKLQQLCIVEGHADSVESLVSISASNFVSAGRDSFIKIWSININEPQNQIRLKLSLTQCSNEILGIKYVVQNQFLSFHSGLQQGYSIILWELSSDQKQIKKLYTLAEKTDELHAHIVIKNPDNPLDFMVMLLLRQKVPRQSRPTYCIIMLDRKLVRFLVDNRIPGTIFLSDQCLLLNNNEYHFLNSGKLALLLEDVQRCSITTSGPARPLSKVTRDLVIMNQSIGGAPFLQCKIEINPL